MIRSPHRLFTRFLLLLGLIIVLGATSAAYAKDNWILVRTPNFNLVGNASEKDVRPGLSLQLTIFFTPLGETFLS